MFGLSASSTFEIRLNRRPRSFSDAPECHHASSTRNHRSWDIALAGTLTTGYVVRAHVGVLASHAASASILLPMTVTSTVDGTHASSLIVSRPHVWVDDDDLPGRAGELFRYCARGFRRRSRTDEALRHVAQFGHIDQFVRGEGQLERK